MTKHWVWCAVAAALLAGGQVLAHEPGAHVHGNATLQIAVDGPTVQLDLDSPLDNLLGFEHAPRSSKEKQAAQAMADTLRRPAALFILTPAAQCTPASVQLTAPVLNLGTPEAGAAQDGDHADLEAGFAFNCRVPSALKDIEVKLFDAFPGIHRLDTQVAGPRGQAAAKLTTKQRRLSW
jgi:hypothetical protein